MNLFSTLTEHYTYFLPLFITWSEVIGSASFLSKSHMCIVEFESNTNMIYGQLLDHKTRRTAAPLVNVSHVIIGDSINREYKRL